MAEPKVKKRYGTKRNPEPIVNLPDQIEAPVVSSEPDDVEERLVGLWEFVRKYRFILVGAMVVIGVGAIVGQIVTSSRTKSRQEVARGFNKALELYDAPVIKPTDDAAKQDLPKDVKTFPSDEAKRKAVLEALNKFASEHEGDDLVPLARLATAGATLQSGDGAAASKALSEYLSANAESPLKVGVQLGLAAAQRAAGQADAAAGTLSAWGGQDDWWFKAWSAMLAGDALVGSNPAKAAESYKAGLAQVGEDKGEIAAAKFLKSEFERRLAMVD